MTRAVAFTAWLLAAWTVFHIVFVAFPEHTQECDGCATRPISVRWVTALRVAAWSAAVVAVGRAHDRPSRWRLTWMAVAIAALTAAMLLLPTPDIPPDGE